MEITSRPLLAADILTSDMLPADDWSVIHAISDGRFSAASSGKYRLLILYRVVFDY